MKEGGKVYARGECKTASLTAVQTQKLGHKFTSLVNEGVAFVVNIVFCGERRKRKGRPVNVSALHRGHALVQRMVGYCFSSIGANMALNNAGS